MVVHMESKKSVGKTAKEYEPLEFLAHYKDVRRRGPLDYLSVLTSIVTHVVVIVILIINPHWLFYPLQYVLPAGIFTSEEESPVNTAQARVLTYLANNRPMYAPVLRKPEGDLYSAQTTTAISRPPQVRQNGNRLPYSRGTTKELTITDIVKKPTTEGSQAKKEAEVSAVKQEPVASLGKPPLASDPSSNPAVNSAAMLLPAKTESEKDKQGNPQGSPTSVVDAGTAVPRKEEAQKPPTPLRQTLEEQKVQIFDNEASALQSPQASGFFDTKGFEFSDYSQYVIDRIKRNWSIPGSVRNANGRSTVIFYIEKDGQISRLRVVNPSGIALLDRAALNSILESLPFPPLPNDFPGEHIGAKLVFAYNTGRSSN